MLTRRLAPSLLRTCPRPVPAPWRRSHSTAPKTCDPLRILFCGSDAFSCESLKALHNEQTQNAELIRSIDVVVRPSKPTGRGYRVMKEVPIRRLAEQLSLPIHERDTFTGWDMPTPASDPINLIIAVSFGLFVPPRLIDAAKYGGLNVHPSILPHLRGPAPIHHALLDEDSHTGITIQTLSPLKFDHGIPLLQTPKPGIPIPPNCTLPHLYNQLAEQGASMLVETLRRGLHVPPHQPQAQNEDDAEEQQLRHASKITADDKQVDWAAPDSARQAVLQERVLGPLWTHLRLPSDGDASKERRGTRVLLEGLEEVAAAPSGEAPQRRGVSYRSRGEAGDEGGKEVFVGEFYAEPGDGGAVVVQMGDGSRLRVWRIKAAGSTWKPARSALKKIGFAGTGVIEFVYVW